jgi:hypothetical protein
MERGGQMKNKRGRDVFSIIRNMKMAYHKMK